MKHTIAAAILLAIVFSSCTKSVIKVPGSAVSNLETFTRPKIVVFSPIATDTGNVSPIRPKFHISN